MLCFQVPPKNTEVFRNSLLIARMTKKKKLSSLQNSEIIKEEKIKERE